MRNRSTLASAAVCLGLLAVAGCGSQASVKGTLVVPQSIQLKDDDSVQIAFYPTDQKGVGAGVAQYSAADKTFVAKAPDGRGFPPGKYKISVQIMPYAGSEERAQQFAELNANYSPEATKLTYDVTDAGSQSITVDLAKGTVTKN